MELFARRFSTEHVAVVPCNYGKFIYYEKYNTGGKNVLASSSVDTIDLVFTDKWGNVLSPGPNETPGS